MPFTPPTWTNGVTALSSANMTTLGTQYTEATNSFEQDTIAAFVYSGLVSTKDGTTATQLDVTAGVAFLVQTDGTLRRRAPTSSTQSTSGNPSTVMYLDLNPDGTWSWATTHSGVSNYLTVAQVTTDSSSNILTVTDERNLTLNLFPLMTGTTYEVGGFGIVTSGGGGLTLNSLVVTGLAAFDSPPIVEITLGGANQKVYEFKASDGDDFAFIIESTNAVLLYNYTSSTSLGVWTTAGVYQAPAIEATSTTSYGGGNYSLIATASAGAIYSDGGHFKTTGSGTLLAAAFTPTNGNGTFNCKGIFSGTGSGTVSHGAGQIPNWVGITCSQSSTSMTVGAASYTSTQVTVTAGGAYTWKGLAE